MVGEVVLIGVPREVDVPGSTAGADASDSEVVVEVGSAVDGGVLVAMTFAELDVVVDRASVSDGLGEELVDEVRAD